MMMFQKYDSNNEIINEVIENYKIANSIPYICCFSYKIKDVFNDNEKSGFL